MMTLPLQPEEEARVIAAAQARGISTDELVREALEGVLTDSLHPGSSASQEETKGELDASQESAFREREIKIKEREVVAKEQEAFAKQEELKPVSLAQSDGDWAICSGFGIDRKCYRGTRQQCQYSA